MIKLPEDWQDTIQIRELLQPVNELAWIVILLWYGKNKLGESWGYALPIRVSAMEYPGEKDARSALVQLIKDKGLEEFIKKVEKEVKKVWIKLDNGLSVKHFKPKNQDWVNLPLTGDISLLNDFLKD